MVNALFCTWLEVETPYVSDGEGACFEVNYSVGAAYEIAEVRSEDQLPGGQVVLRSIDDRIDAEIFVAERGPRVLLRLIDRVAQMACLPQMTSAGPRCGYPQSFRVFDEGLRTLNCNEVVVTGRGNLPVTSLVRDGEDLGVHRYVPYDGEVSVIDQRGRCVPTEVDPGAMLHLAKPYGPERWPPIAIESGGAGGLVWQRARLPELDAINTTQGAAFTIAATGASCRAAAVNGEIRCVPILAVGVSNGGFVQKYTDSRCTDSAFAAEEGSDLPRPYFRGKGTLSDPEQGSLPVVELVQVGRRIPQDALFVAVDGVCQPYDSANDPLVYYAVDVVPDVDEYPMLRLVLE